MAIALVVYVKTGKYDHCKDKPKFGGLGCRKKCCTQRKCRMIASSIDEPVKKVRQEYHDFGGLTAIGLVFVGLAFFRKPNYMKKLQLIVQNPRLL